MKKMTKNEFIAKCRYPDLAKAVLNQMGATWKEIIKYPYDYQDASGGISGFIYYNETTKFAKQHLLKIINALNDFETECGLLPNKPTEDETQYLNWLSWFALENTIAELISYIEE